MLQDIESGLDSSWARYPTPRRLRNISRRGAAAVAGMAALVPYARKRAYDYAFGAPAGGARKRKRAFKRRPKRKLKNTKRSFGRNRRGKRRSRPLKSRVHSLEKAANAAMAKTIVKDFVFIQKASLPNRVEYTEFKLNNSTNLNQAVSQLKIMNPATSQLVNYDPDLGTEALDVNVSSYQKLTCRNNAKTDAYVTFYEFVCLQDGPTTPQAAIEEDMLDNPHGVINPVTTWDNPNWFPNFGNIFKVNFKITKTTKKYLTGGASCQYSFKAKDLKLDMSVLDDHVNAYEPTYNQCGVLVRQEGGIGHDFSTTTRVGRCGALLDFEQENFYTVSYAAGANFTDRIFIGTYPIVNQGCQTSVDLDNIVTETAAGE